jgi:hypothetical protein
MAAGSPYSVVAFWSARYKLVATCKLRRLFIELVTLALRFAEANTGKRMAATIAMIATTTISSIVENPRLFIIPVGPLLSSLYHA